jgi:hypothetical protein
MKQLFLFIGLTVTACAAPPSSLQGLVYRDLGGPIALRTVDELSLDFIDSASFHSILWWQKSTISNLVIGYHAPLSGSYTYEKISENEYQLALTEADGTSTAILLHFQDDSSGTFERSVPLIGADGTPGTATYKSYGAFWLQHRSDNSRRTLAAVSTRAVARAGDPLIVGFVVPVESNVRDVLIRVVGPGLAKMGVSDYWSRPTYYLAHKDGPDTDTTIDNFISARTGSWSSTATAQATAEWAFNRAGAFSLEPGSSDLADVVRLKGGAYTVVVLPPEAAPAGTVLVEVYEL